MKDHFDYSQEKLPPVMLVTWVVKRTNASTLTMKIKIKIKVVGSRRELGAAYLSIAISKVHRNGSCNRIRVNDKVKLPLKIKIINEHNKPSQILFKLYVITNFFEKKVTNFIRNLIQSFWLYYPLGT